jgi:hypothetical protein
MADSRRVPRVWLRIVFKPSPRTAIKTGQGDVDGRAIVCGVVATKLASNRV